MSASQVAAGSRLGSRAVHPAALFTSDGRPIFPAHLRHLSPSIILAATFSIAIGGRIEDRRAPHEKIVAGCEGGSCALADNSKAAPNG
jgi:hypothetical protein